MAKPICDTLHAAESTDAIIGAVPRYPPNSCLSAISNTSGSNEKMPGYNQYLRQSLKSNSDSISQLTTWRSDPFIQYPIKLSPRIAKLLDHGRCQHMTI